MLIADATAAKPRKTSGQNAAKQPTSTQPQQQVTCDGPQEATCQQPDLVKFSVSGAVHAAQHNEIDRLERLVETHVAHVSRLETRHAENMKACDVMSVLLANMSPKVKHFELEQNLLNWRQLENLTWTFLKILDNSTTFAPLKTEINVQQARKHQNQAKKYK